MQGGGDADVSKRVEEAGCSTDPIARAIAAHRPGHALGQPFYCDPSFFECELAAPAQAALALRGAPQPGTRPRRLLHSRHLVQESLIVVCDQDRQLRALLNVCRHRGSRVCNERSGHARAGAFVCPYHAWSYNLDGTLRAARYAPSDFDRTQYGLKSVHLRVIEGLIFICLADLPLGFEDVETVLAGAAGRIRLGRRPRWRTARAIRCSANWKLVEENYMECYHCAPAHAEYSRFHLYARPEGAQPGSRRPAPCANARLGTRDPGR